MCRRELACVLIFATMAIPAQDVTLYVVLARLHQYRATTRASASHCRVERTSVVDRERVLRIEFGIVRVPNHPQWLGFGFHESDGRSCRVNWP